MGHLHRHLDLKEKRLLALKSLVRVLLELLAILLETLPGTQVLQYRLSKKYDFVVI